MASSALCPAKAKASLSTGCLWGLGFRVLGFRVWVPLGCVGLFNENRMDPPTSVLQGRLQGQLSKDSHITAEAELVQQNILSSQRQSPHNLSASD